MLPDLVETEAAEPRQRNAWRARVVLVAVLVAIALIGQFIDPGWFKG